MKADNLKTGQLGEGLAADYLEQKGYQILERNFKTKYLEIDLVAKQKNVIIFVEVRTKKGDSFGTPEDSLNKKKLQKLWWNAQSYVKHKRFKGVYRIDAICVVLNLDNSLKRINHYENIV